MAMTNAERQQRYRKAKITGQQRIEAVLPFEVAIKLNYLAAHWGCTKPKHWAVSCWQPGSGKGGRSQGMVPRVNWYSGTRKSALRGNGF